MFVIEVDASVRCEFLRLTVRACEPHVQTDLLELLNLMFAKELCKGLIDSIKACAIAHVHPSALRVEPTPTIHALIHAFICDCITLCF